MNRFYLLTKSSQGCYEIVKLHFKSNKELLELQTWGNYFLQKRYLKYEPIVTENKIEIGHKMTQVIEKKRQVQIIKKREEEKFSNLNLRSNRKLLIAASNPVFNHYTGQVYKKFSETNLASWGWKNRRSVGNYFTINPIGTHPSLIRPDHLRTENDERIEFSHLHLNQVLIDRLKPSNILTPTYIQYLSLNEILNRESHFTLLAETGGGKTLCYALPIIECAIRVKHNLDRIKLKRDNNQPIGIILVPTRELAFQVYKFFNRLINEKEQEVKEEYRSYIDYLNNLNVVIDLHQDVIKTKESLTKQRINSLNKNTKDPIDILITLPGQLEDRLEREKYFNSTYLRHMVVDEADTLLDDSFSKVTINCMNMLRMNLNLPKVEIQGSALLDEEEKSQEFKKIDFYLKLDEKLKDPSTQLIFSSATIPSKLQVFLNNLLNLETEMKTIRTNRVNRLMLHVPQKFIRTNGKQRPKLLLELLDKSLKKNSKYTFMVFCYRTKTAVYVAKFLRENGVNCELLAKVLKNYERDRVVERFFSGDVRILCCTDIASRGWDTVNVNHVINFEMPQYIADYLHRVGRVGRLGTNKVSGSGGMVTNFIANKNDAQLVWNIEKSIRLGVELEEVNANIKELYQNAYRTDKEDKYAVRNQEAEKEETENDYIEEENDNQDNQDDENSRINNVKINEN